MYQEKYHHGKCFWMNFKLTVAYICLVYLFSQIWVGMFAAGDLFLWILLYLMLWKEFKQNMKVFAKLSPSQPAFPQLGGGLRQSYCHNCGEPPYTLPHTAYPIHPEQQFEPQQQVSSRQIVVHNLLMTCSLIVHNFFVIFS